MLRRPRAVRQSQLLLLDYHPMYWRRSSCRKWSWLALGGRLLREEGLAAIVSSQHAQKILPITARALISIAGGSCMKSATPPLLADSARSSFSLGVTTPRA